MPDARIDRCLQSGHDTDRTTEPGFSTGSGEEYFEGQASHKENFYCIVPKSLHTNFVKNGPVVSEKRKF